MSRLVDILSSDKVNLIELLQHCNINVTKQASFVSKMS